MQDFIIYREDKQKMCVVMDFETLRKGSKILLKKNKFIDMSAYTRRLE